MLTAEQAEALLHDLESDRVERTTSADNTDEFAQAVCSDGVATATARAGRATTVTKSGVIIGTQFIRRLSPSDAAGGRALH